MTDVACLAAMISAVPSATRTSTWSRTNFRYDLGGALATGYPASDPVLGWVGFKIRAGRRASGRW
jgi:hypothetical protein